MQGRMTWAGFRGRASNLARAAEPGRQNRQMLARPAGGTGGPGKRAGQPEGPIWRTREGRRNAGTALAKGNSPLPAGGPPPHPKSAGRVGPAELIYDREAELKTAEKAGPAGTGLEKNEYLSRRGFR